MLQKNGEINIIEIKPKEINKIANIVKNKSRDGHSLKYNPVADLELRVENGQIQIIVVEGEGTVSVYGLKRE